MPDKRFCHFCGARLTTKFWENRQRLFCEHCNEPIYENPVPATCLVVLREDSQVLLVRRSVEPKKGLWCLPGGFMELGESPEAAALRELHEETGVHGHIDRLLGVMVVPNAMYDSVLMIGYRVVDHHGEPIPGDDACEVAFFSPARLPDIAFSSHRHFINACLGGQAPWKPGDVSVRCEIAGLDSQFLRHRR